MGHLKFHLNGRRETREKKMAFSDEKPTAEQKAYCVWERWSRSRRKDVCLSCVYFSRAEFTPERPDVLEFGGRIPFKCSYKKE